MAWEGVLMEKLLMILACIMIASCSNFSVDPCRTIPIERKVQGGTYEATEYEICNDKVTRQQRI